VMVNPPDPNSMLRWWPLTNQLAIPQPRTILIPADRRYLSALLDPHAASDEEQRAYMDWFWKRFYPNADEIGYPLFMRTDLVSGKHDWDDTCYVKGRLQIAHHLYRLLEANELAGIMGVNYQAIAFRQYIPLASPFKAFRGMPVAAERRYFVEDGKVRCHHPYWTEAVIAHSRNPNLPGTWRAQLAELNAESDAEVGLLSAYAATISAALDGAWSVDFAKTVQDNWIFIDAATAAESWHPDCAVNGPGNDDEDDDLTDEDAAMLLDLKIPEPEPQ
jgi:hypothetical protein